MGIPCLRFGEPGDKNCYTPAEKKKTPLAAGARPLDVEAASDIISWRKRDGFDRPRFARGLRKLIAPKTRLWARWNLCEFPLLTVVEVSHAGRGLLQQLSRKV